MRDAVNALSRRGMAVDLEALEPLEDSEVWEMIASGGARAVHHIESPAITLHMGILLKSKVYLKASYLSESLRMRALDDPAFEAIYGADPTSENP